MKYSTLSFCVSFPQDYVCEIHPYHIWQQFVHLHCSVIFHYVTNHHLFIHCTVDRHLDCFQFGTILDTDVVNTLVHVIWKTYVLSSAGHIPQNGSVGSLGCTKWLYRFIPDYSTVYEEFYFLHTLTNTQILIFIFLLSV